MRTASASSTKITDTNFAPSSVNPVSNPTGSSGSSSSTSTSTSPSSIPSTAVTLDSLQDGNGQWFDCSDCAGGAVTSSYYSWANQGSPSLTGNSRKFNISGGPWSDVLWIRKLGARNSATHFLWDFYVYFDNDSAANVWAAEYDFWQVINHQKFMVGSQCVFGENHWDIWDSSVSKWIDTGIPCPRFSGGEWHHIAWDVERISDSQYRYNTLWVDDRTIPIGRTFYAEPSNWDDDLGVQWQLDQNGAGAPVSQWVDKVKLTMW